MAAIPALHTAVRDLVNIVLDVASAGAAVNYAQTNALKFAVPENYDLHDFCAKLAAFTQNNALKTSAQAVGNAVLAAVIAAQHTGDTLAAEKGLAIYSPRQNRVARRFHE